MKKFSILLLLSLTFIPAVSAGTIQLNTYYPSPFGSYDRLRLVPRGPLAISDCNANSLGLLYIETPDIFHICQEDGIGGYEWGFLSGIWKQQQGKVFLTDFLLNSTFNINIGIGTIDPQTDIHIVSDDGQAGIRLEENSGFTGAIWELKADENIPGGIDGNSFSIYGGTAGTLADRLVIRPSGNIGIGTSSPRYQLHINDIIGSGAAFRIQSDTGDTAIEFGDSTAAGGGGAATGGYDSWRIQRSRIGDTLNIQKMNTSNLQTSNRLLLDKYGRVAINAVALPTQELEIEGPLIYPANPGVPVIPGYDKDTAIRLVETVDVDSIWELRAYDDVPVADGNAFSIYGGSPLADRMVITAAGDVGIGTGAAAPTAIAGTVTVHINSLLRLTPRVNVPAACTAALQGLIYADTSGALCHCKGATGWEDLTDGATIGAGGCI